MNTPTNPRPAPLSPSAGNYRTLWRWHFYAALFVMPFLVVLAITGTVYCFQPQIEPLLYPHLLTVAPVQAARLSDDVLLARAGAAAPAGSLAAAASIDRDPARSAEFVFRYPDGEKRSVYVNPYTGQVLGNLSVERRFMQVDRMIHRKLLIGKPGELIMELAACWTLVMVGTGVALWWPRTAFTWRGTLWPRFSLRGRPLWKSVHAVMGIWLAVGAVAFILTGLPWSGSWGRNLQSLATRVNMGSPPGAWGDTPLRSAIPGQSAHPALQQDHGDGGHHGHAAESMPGMVMDDLPLSQTPWAVGASAVPTSGHEGLAAVPLTLDQVVGIARSRGLVSGYDVALPSGPTGVYTVSYFPADPRDERTLHIDQYGGKVLEDIGYDDYGAISRVVSYGTSLHMGRYFGLANQMLCALISIGLAAMAVTGSVMWWKRRPRNALGAPARLTAPSSLRGWVAGLAFLGAVFPLMGISLLFVWALDAALVRRSAV
ncbi:PepSY-associated TM helix domain-containing protein [Bordetella flabilis]|uniref:Peptidase n=1 Tax=Bordetella flabilis TaxID=463014 RepID=A0A193GAM1_9BORD|nr:PepSY domain-containing protein [Bordetella flabilis]ANN76319.1 peptidase [Bordetella flabilis]